MGCIYLNFINTALGLRITIMTIISDTLLRNVPPLFLAFNKATSDKLEGLKSSLKAVPAATKDDDFFLAIEFQYVAQLKGVEVSNDFLSIMLESYLNNPNTNRHEASEDAFFQACWFDEMELNDYESLSNLYKIACGRVLDGMSLSQ
jgi:hypothetical protein